MPVIRTFFLLLEHKIIFVSKKKILMPKSELGCCKIFSNLFLWIFCCLTFLNTIHRVKKIIYFMLLHFLTPLITKDKQNLWQIWCSVVLMDSITKTKTLKISVRHNNVIKAISFRRTKLKICKVCIRVWLRIRSTQKQKPQYSKIRTFEKFAIFTARFTTTREVVKAFWRMIWKI